MSHNSEDFYNTNHPKLGVALVFNHVTFEDDKEKRIGSEKDTKDLSEVLSDLGFDTRIFMDLTVENIRKELMNVSIEDHSNNDCLVVVVMTHGDDKRLSAFDKEYNRQELMDSFANDQCKSLQGKPKLFFIQACRGEKFDFGTCSKSTQKQRGEVYADAKSFGNPQASFEATNADTLVMCSSQPGYVSFRNKQNGSWLIQALCSELKKCRNSCNGTDILQMLTKVNRRVSLMYSVGDDGGILKQMSTFSSNLTKMFVMKMKNA